MILLSSFLAGVGTWLFRCRLFKDTQKVEGAYDSRDFSRTLLAFHPVNMILSVQHTKSHSPRVWETRFAAPRIGRRFNMQS